MKYFKRLKVYKNYNGTNHFDPESMTAYSYGWWCYFKRINGQLVFNYYSYSHTTCKHQRQLGLLLRELGIKDYIKIEAPGGLQDLDSGLKLYRSRIKALIKQIKKKGTRKTTNERRREDIRLYRQRMHDIYALKAA